MTEEEVKRTRPSKTKTKYVRGAVTKATPRSSSSSSSSTWITADHLTTEYSFPGYESFFKNRLNKKGGGVMCYVKNTPCHEKKKKKKL